MVCCVVLCAPLPKKHSHIIASINAIVYKWHRNHLHQQLIVMTFIHMPVAKTVCVIFLQKKWVQSEVCRTLVGRDMDMNVTAQ